MMHIKQQNIRNIEHENSEVLSPIKISLPIMEMNFEIINHFCQTGFPAKSKKQNPFLWCAKPEIFRLKSKTSMKGSFDITIKLPLCNLIVTGKSFVHLNALYHMHYILSSIQSYFLKLL